MNMRRQFSGHIFMTAQLVTDMGKVCGGYFQRIHHVDGFAQGEMGEMFFMPERIQYHYLAPAYFFLLRGINAVGICDVGEFAQPEAEYRHVQVPYQDGYYGNVTDMKRFQADGVEADFRNARVFMLIENIHEFAAQCFFGDVIGIYIHRFSPEKAVGFYIIQTGNMVLVRVRKQYGIELPHFLPQHLVTKIGRGINDKTGGRALNEDTAAQSFVARIMGTAHITGTGNHGYAGTGTGSEKGDGEGRADHTVIAPAK